MTRYYVITEETLLNILEADVKENQTIWEVDNSKDALWQMKENDAVLEIGDCPECFKDLRDYFKNLD